jgi:hypothetical protein
MDLDQYEVRYLRKLAEADLAKHRRSVPKLRRKLGVEFDRAGGRTDGRSAAERTAQREKFVLGVVERLKVEEERLRAEAERRPKCPNGHGPGGYHDRGHWYCVECNAELV